MYADQLKIDRCTDVSPQTTSHRIVIFQGHGEPRSVSQRLESASDRKLSVGTPGPIWDGGLKHTYSFLIPDSPWSMTTFYGLRPIYGNLWASMTAKGHLGSAAKVRLHLIWCFYVYLLSLTPHATYAFFGSCATTYGSQSYLCHLRPSAIICYVLLSMASIVA